MPIAVELAMSASSAGRQLLVDYPVQGISAVCRCAGSPEHAARRYVARAGARMEPTPVTRVALVEDDRETRARLAPPIRAQDSLRLEAEYATGAEALAGLESAAPDVLLVDLGLPDISGLDGVRFVA